VYEDASLGRNVRRENMASCVTLSAGNGNPEKNAIDDVKGIRVRDAVQWGWSL
jgi:hypothetical protein